MKINNPLQTIDERTVLGSTIRIYGSFEEPLYLARDVARERGTRGRNSGARRHGLQAGGGARRLSAGARPAGGADGRSGRDGARRPRGCLVAGRGTDIRERAQRRSQGNPWTRMQFEFSRAKFCAHVPNR